MMLRFSMIVASCLISGPLLANGILTPNLSAFYFSETGKRNIDGPNNLDVSQKTKTTHTFIGLGACYTIESICFGLKYLQAEKEIDVTSAGSSITKSTWTGPAVTLGYSDPGGLVVHLNYFVSAKKQLEVSGQAVRIYPVKTGYALDIGYGAKVGSVRLGPMVSIYQFTYSEVKQNGETTKLVTKEADDFLMPQLALWVDL